MISVKARSTRNIRDRRERRLVLTRDGSGRRRRSLGRRAAHSRCRRPCRRVLASGFSNRLLVEPYVGRMIRLSEARVRLLTNPATLLPVWLFAADDDPRLLPLAANNSPARASRAARTNCSSCLFCGELLSVAAALLLADAVDVTLRFRWSCCCCCCCRKLLYDVCKMRGLPKSKFKHLTTFLIKY